MAKKKNTYIITTFGTDGAVSAALALEKFPKSRILITSANRLHTTLKELEDNTGKTIYICGVGAGEYLSSTIESLLKLRKNANSITWLCGRGYLTPYEAELQNFCNTCFKDFPSNSALAADFFQIAPSKHTTYLLELAEEFIAGSDTIPQEHRWWQDLIRASASRYFKYDDIRSYTDCIRKLAGIKEPTQQDQDEVDNWRENGARTQLIGNSPALKKLRQQISLVGPVEAPVLILGESGSGKELTARLIHESSPRAKGAFIAVNCAVLSTNSDLAHDRLFGHLKGSYTGATSDSIGAFDAAEGGTLFLDEFAELPISVQTQLLRALEENEIVPLGSIQPHRINVRIIAATNGNLPTMVKDGRFRLDLYYRLNVLPLNVPSLRERITDLKSIARSFIHQLSGSGYTLNLEDKDWLAAERYNWPGNIRQFINLLRRCAYLQITLKEAIRQEIDSEPPAHTSGDSGIYFPTKLKEALPECEIRREYMKHVLELAGGSHLKAAHALNISVNTLKRWL